MDNLDLGSKQQLDIQLENRRGWMVPADDEVALEIILREVNDLDTILPYCKKFRTCIQAGANVGIWPVALARKFETVITVEPDAANYQALLCNIRAFPNIRHSRVAFGADVGSGSIDVPQQGNIGAHQVIAGADFSIITIDSLGVNDCDLLQLDIEGYEHFALMGAVNTLSKCKPVVVLELKGLGVKHGYTDQATMNFLSDFGYKFVHQIHNDFIFTAE